MGGEGGGVRGAPTRVGVRGIIKRGENKFEISVHPVLLDSPASL